VNPLILFAVQLGVVIGLGVIWTQVGRLGQRAKKRPETTRWIQMLALVVVACAIGGALYILTSRTWSDRLLGLAALAIGAGAVLAAWALWRRTPAPDEPGTTESFTVSIPVGAFEAWPRVVRARGLIQVDPPERELVRARIWLVGGTEPIPSDMFLLTDRRLVVRSAGENLVVPRSRLRTVTYHPKRDRITITYATESDGGSIDLLVPQWITHGPFTGTHRLYQALQTGLLNPKSIGEPLRVEPPTNARPWIVAGLLFLAVAGSGLAFMISHYLDLRAAARAYDQTPICTSVSTDLCRDQESVVALGNGQSHHPDGTGGGKAWVMFRTEKGIVLFADLPHPLTVRPASDERIIIEVWRGRLSQVAIQRQIQVTYDNPNWTASNYVILVGMAAVGAAIILGLFAWAGWRDLRRERPQVLGQAA
jgi:hypothetical protein